MVADKGGTPGKLVPELEALLELWRRRYGARAIPERSRFDAFELEPWARRSAWIEIEGDDVLRIRKFGIDLIRRFGRESTGQCVDDLAGDIATSLREIVWRAMAASEPAMGRASVKLGRAPALFSELALPLSRDDRRVNLVMLASYETSAPPKG